MEKRKFGVAFFTPTPCPEVLYRNSEREVISCGIKMQNVSDFNGDRGKTCLKGVELELEAFSTSNMDRVKGALSGSNPRARVGEEGKKKEDKKTRRQEDKKTRRQEDKKTRRQEDKKTRRQEDKKTRRQEDKKTRRQEDKKTRRQEDKKSDQNFHNPSPCS
ncbi:conserved hypothetical protein [Culex quinquefasciatus]|uniref:Uncharacterized protein n=1 Tax=Culex quinquefasciatus TaxID=7176 RepID=B0WXJ6_CULQU|nr:conserved hypothetical protein [Culex quinquefasciatus]|eukprot:XP_001862118.1 conserved hypothetical protein [Culex quinquefasciatus]